ncbi:hypothetical protein ADUPG1_001542, partial [Aduncisulcus paluster]
MTGKTPYEALFGDFRKPARGTLLDWKDEVEEATLTDDVTPGEEMCEYVTMLKKRVTEIQEIMRIAQKEATERRDAKVIRDVDKANDKLDGALTRGLVDVPADANGQLTPEKDYVYRRGTYVIENPAVKPGHKISPRIHGPYLVVDHIKESETVVIRDLKSKKDKRVTAARIIPFDDARMSLDDMIALTELDSSEYIVEEIVSHRYTSAGKMPMVERYTFEVVWLGWPNPTWEEYRYIVKTPAFREYCRSRPELQRVYANKMKATKSRKKRKSRFALDEESESSE